MRAVAYSSSSGRGAALLVTLVLVSALALVVVFLFSLAREKTALVAPMEATVRVELGEEAAFAAALARLRSHVDSDEYFVTMVRGVEAGESDAAEARYTFLSIPDVDKITHVPLFSGGKVQTKALPDWNAIPTHDLADQSPSSPQVVFENESESSDSGPSLANWIQLPPLEGLAPQDQLLAENSRPLVGIEHLPAPSESSSPWRVRYVYWVEDMEGYPNADMVSVATEEHPASWLGYREGDSRIDEARVFSLESIPEMRYRFPLSYRGQNRIAQIAPGLSAREIVLQTWPLDSGARHPYADMQALTQWRGWDLGYTNFSSPQQRRAAQRIVRGLSPYLVMPMIPYGHGYVEEGQPRHNLNTLVAHRDMRIADVIEKNLPQFDQRKGGFPPDESYLATLAANAIDYADEDGLPALPTNTTHAEGRVFRGVDAYCPVNEFYVKFQYLGYEVEGKNDIILFEATPYAEFWNPFDHEVQMEQVRLRFRFLERIRFQANSVWHEIKEEHKTRDEAFAESTGISFAVPPNHYHIARFGALRWEIPVPRPPTVAFPIVQDLRGVSNVSVRAHYELYLGDDLVDRCARPAPGDLASKPTHGFFFSRNQPVIQADEFFMRLAIPCLAPEGYGAIPTPVGSHLGDPWMPWFSHSTAEAAQYKLKASPGFRNYDRDKVKSAQPDRLKDQTRVRGWPDGGYDSPHPEKSEGPTGDEDFPEFFQSSVDPKAADLAPWRLSQLGRFYSVTELGHLHDPVMWMPVPEDSASEFVSTQPNTHRYETLRAPLKSLPLSAEASELWGGGNTLRIGRPEHTLFDQPGMRASQLLDLFHVGHPGGNLLGVEGSSQTLYDHYDPRDHQPPPSAPDSASAANPPYSSVYDANQNAQGLFAVVYGHLNLNTIPTRLEMETLLRGPSVSSDVRLVEDRYDTPEYRREGDRTGGDTSGSTEGSPTLRSALRSEAIPELAEDLMRARPFYSPSHFARVFSELLRRHDALPESCKDAEAEEPFARIFNETSLSSRHFRIYTAAEVYHEKTREVVGRRRRVREIFARPIRDSQGRIERVAMEVLSRRELY